eukprot:9503694-Pyramimonas_sp.AAC.1
MPSKTYIPSHSVPAIVVPDRTHLGVHQSYLPRAFSATPKTVEGKTGGRVREKDGAREGVAGWGQ